MEENKNNGFEGVSLNLDALSAPKEEKKIDVGMGDVELAEIEGTEVENVRAQEDPSVIETENIKYRREKKTRAPKEKRPKLKGARKPPRQLKAPALPIKEPALPLLLSTVVFAISLIALCIDRFVYPFSQELLAPVILQLTALVIPAYLAMMITNADKSIGMQLKDIGIRKVKAEYVFFMIFTALFAMCASLAVTLMLGGAEEASRGITLLGTFTAGVNEYTVSVPYLILTYAILPSIAEELLFRGVIFSRLQKVSFPLAAILSCAINALYGFSLGGLIPTLLIAVILMFVLYTTDSLVCCVIVHLLVNLYRLFLEANISAYFLSSQNNFLLLITIAIALLISSLLFFSESARIYRARAVNISEGKKKSANKRKEFKAVSEEIRSTLAYKPSLICILVCAAIFLSVVIINYVIK